MDDDEDDRLASASTTILLLWSMDGSFDHQITDDVAVRPVNTPTILFTAVSLVGLWLVSGHSERRESPLRDCVKLVSRTSRVVSWPTHETIYSNSELHQTTTIPKTCGLSNIIDKIKIHAWNLKEASNRLRFRTFAPSLQSNRARCSRVSVLNSKAGTRYHVTRARL